MYGHTNVENYSAAEYCTNMFENVETTAMKCQCWEWIATNLKTITTNQTDEPITHQQTYEVYVSWQMF